MLSGIVHFDDPFHEVFISGDWDLKKIKNAFGDIPTILTRVLQRRSCSVDIVKLLLNHGADINCHDEHGYSPLMIALRFLNDEAIIRELLEGGADVNKVHHEENRTPLLIFLQREDCSVRIVEVLLDFKADVNHKDKYGNSPLTTAIRKSIDDAVIRALVERGAEVNDSNNLHYSPLSVFLRERKNCSVNILKLLIAKFDNYKDINYKDNQGHSPLVIALQKSRDEAVIQALLEKGADVNMIIHHCLTPLLLYVSDYFTTNCSIGIVKLLLSYNAELNNSEIYTPLIAALRFKKDKAIIKMLLESGVNVNTVTATGESTLCIAFKYSSNDIVKLLLDAGSSPNACTVHISALYCATDFSCSGLRADILKLLLEANNDVNNVTSNRQSLLCFALQNGAKANDIQLLLNAGASLNTCVRHSSPLICATDVCAPLRGEVIKVLLDSGASVDGEDLKILQNALRFSEYDVRAIQLLLDIPGMKDYVVANKLLLHHAVQNRNCKPDALQLLINQKAEVLALDKNSETSLHYAASNRECDPSVINLLLKNGSPVNAKTRFGETPLTLAMEKHFECNILKELLLADAHINTTHVFGKEKWKYCQFLEVLADQWESCEDLQMLSSYELLGKFFILQNPEFDSKNFLCQQANTNHCIKKCLFFVNKCLSELEKMNLFQMSHGRTFCMFVTKNGSSLGNKDLVKLLTYLARNVFPVYFDLIVARIGRPLMEAEVQKLQLYTKKISSMEQVNLNRDIVNKISGYLPEEDLLKFILASYIPVNHNGSGETCKDDSSRQEEF